MYASAKYLYEGNGELGVVGIFPRSQSPSENVSSVRPCRFPCLKAAGTITGSHFKSGWPLASCQLK